MPKECPISNVREICYTSSGINGLAGEVLLLAPDRLEAVWSLTSANIEDGATKSLYKLLAESEAGGETSKNSIIT
jgi:hypothetical protein